MGFGYRCRNSKGSKTYLGRELDYDYSFLTKREKIISKILSLREGIPLPESSLYGRKRHNAKAGEPFKGEQLLGPWEGGLRFKSLSLEIINKARITSKRMTAEEVEKALKRIQAIEAKAGGNYLVTSMAEMTAKSTASTTTEQKAKVTTLNKEIRHQVDVGKELLIEVTDECWNKMQCWIGMTTREISGLGCVRQDTGGKFIVYDVFLFEQENTYTFTDIDDIAVQKLMVELDEMDEKDGGKRFSDLKFWWHSHADLEVNWSTQDDHNIEKKLFGDNTDGKAVCPWWLSMVLNKKGKVNTRLDIASPWLTLERISYRIKNVVPLNTIEFCKEEYKRKVREKNYSTTTKEKNEYSSSVYGNQYDWEEKRYRVPQTGVSSNPAGSVKPTEASKIAITSADQEAYVPVPDRPKELAKVTSLGAYRLWEKEIVAGLVYIAQTCFEHRCSGIEIVGLALRPLKIPGMKRRQVYDTETKEYVERDDQFEWTVFGNIKITSHILTIWPSAFAMHLSRVIALSEVSAGARVSITAGEQYHERCTKFGIETMPDLEYTDASSEAVVGIIFNVSGTPLPYRTLGDIIFPDGAIEENYNNITKKKDSHPSQETEKAKEDWADDDEWGTPINIVSPAEPKAPDKDTATQNAIDKTEEVTQEDEDDLFSEMLAYATASPRSDIINRIEGWAKKMERNDLTDVIEVLEREIQSEFPEFNLSSAATTMNNEELVEILINLAKADYENAFATIFLMIRSKSYCPQCYEPLFEQTTQCPYCKEHFAEN